MQLRNRTVQREAATERASLLLFTGNIPRGVFCEWSAAKVTENPRIAARNGIFAVSVHREACYWERSVQ